MDREVPTRPEDIDLEDIENQLSLFDWAGLDQETIDIILSMGDQDDVL